MNIDLRFHAPFTCIIGGPTGSGKSHIVFRLIKYRSEMIDTEFEKVIYCLPHEQTIKIPDFVRNDKRVVFHSGFPNFDKFNNGKPYLIILDDLMNDAKSDVMNLFTRQSHHRNLSVVFLVQNIFFNGCKFFRTISLNCHYIILTKNPRDRNQISSLAVQLNPDNVRFVKEAYNDATKEPYQYLLFDLSQKCLENLRYRANIFPDDNPRNIIYNPLKSKESFEKCQRT